MDRIDVLTDITRGYLIIDEDYKIVESVKEEGHDSDFPVFFDDLDIEQYAWLLEGALIKIYKELKECKETLRQADAAYSSLTGGGK